MAAHTNDPRRLTFQPRDVGSLLEHLRDLSLSTGARIGQEEHRTYGGVSSSGVPPTTPDEHRVPSSAVPAACVILLASFLLKVPVSQLYGIVCCVASV